MEQIAENILFTSLIVLALTVIVAKMDREGEVTDMFSWTPVVGSVLFIGGLCGLIVSTITLIWV